MRAFLPVGDISFAVPLLLVVSKPPLQRAFIQSIAHTGVKG